MRCLLTAIARDGNGNIVPSATITPFLYGTSTAVSIYTTLTGATAVNSTTAGDDGSFSFYVDRFDYDRDQCFDIQISKTSGGHTWTTWKWTNVDIRDVVLGTYAIAADKTVTTNLGYIPKGVIYAPATGKTLTISGTLDAGDYQIFSGEGTVTLPGQRYVLVDWFGVNTTPGTTDMTSAINSAINSITSGDVIFSGNIYAVSTTLESSTASHPIKLKGNGKVETNRGTRIKWIGGDSDSILELNSYMQVEDMTIYNGNSSTGLIGIDALGADGVVPKTHLILRNVHVKSCAVNYAFQYSYYNNLYDCTSSYGDIGFDMRTHANNTNFWGCHITAGVIGITNENGSGSLQMLWSGGSIEKCTAYGIKTRHESTQAWVFLNPYLENNYQHLINGHIRIDRPYINSDGGDGTRPPFDISSANDVQILSPYMTPDITQLFTISGSASAYASKGITVIAPYDSTEVAASIYATPAFLTRGYINSLSYVRVETPWYDASGAIEENIITIGEADGLGVSARLIYAQIIVDTLVTVTGSNFTVSMGKSATFNEVATKTFTTNVDVGAYELPLVDAAPMTIYPAAYSYKVAGTAATSGKYKVVFYFVR